MIAELDRFLQHMLDSVEPAASLSCSIGLQLASGEQVELQKNYKSRRSERPDRPG